MCDGCKIVCFYSNLHEVLLDSRKVSSQGFSLIFTVPYLFFSVKDPGKRRAVRLNIQFHCNGQGEILNKRLLPGLGPCDGKTTSIQFNMTRVYVYAAVF